MATATQIILATLLLYLQNATWRSSPANTAYIERTKKFQMFFYDMCHFPANIFLNSKSCDLILEIVIGYSKSIFMQKEKNSVFSCNSKEVENRNGESKDKQQIIFP